MQLYEVLDDFFTPIDTRIAIPKVEEKKVGDITTHTEWVVGKRWPVQGVPLMSWAAGTLLSEHCQWMLQQESIRMYTQAYWKQWSRIPSLSCNVFF